MIFIHDNKRLVITDQALAVFNQFKQTNKKNEQGGILLGEVRENEIRITKVSVPTIFDKSSRYRFNRNKKSAQIIVDYEFYNSQGKTIYLGEWHTHPENYPTPSNTDRKMIKAQFDKNFTNEEFLFMIIVGLKNLYVSIYDGISLKKITIEE